MRVAVDARTAQQRPLAGVGRALAQTLPLLADRAEITLLTEAGAPPAEVELSEQALSTPWPGLWTEWLQWSAPRWLAGFGGIFHCPFYGLPFRQPVPMVVTLHDLTFEHFPGWMPAMQRRLFQVQARWAARTARAVLTPTDHVADDVAATYGVSHERLFVAPNAVDPVFRPGLDPAPVLARLGVREPYAVAVGGAVRRRPDVAVQVWREARASGTALDLVVVGSDSMAAEPGLASGRLDDAAWAAVLSGAVALIYPTEYEGFGMPALEALASGTPVICAPVGALPEVLGDAAGWCDGPADMAAALRRLVSDRVWAEDLREAGLGRAAAAPTWADAADAHVAAYGVAAASL